MEQLLRGKDQRKNLLSSQLRKVHGLSLAYDPGEFVFFSVLSNVSTGFSCVFLEQAPEGLEKAIMTMRRREEATVSITAEYLSDKINLPTTPANKVLYYEVQLVDFIKVGFS